MGLVRWRVPNIVSVPQRLAQFMADEQAQHRKEADAAAPLKDLPLYPGQVVDDYSGGGVVQSNGFRAFSISTASSDEAAEWYKGELSKAPWTLERAQRQVTIDHAGADLHTVHVVYNCLQARKDQGNGQSRMYYWQIWRHDDMDMVRVMVETPERPGVWYCK